MEARPELGYAPISEDAYRLGYSFERLRELESVELLTEEAEEGFYIHECLKRLFDMVYNGTASEAERSLFGADGQAHAEITGDDRPARWLASLPARASSMSHRALVKVSTAPIRAMHTRPASPVIETRRENAPSVPVS